MIPVISIVGHKNAGKTTLVEALIQELTARGYRVGAIKHDAHNFQIDHEGKDSWRFAHAGAATVAIASASRCAVITQGGDIPELEELVAQHFGAVDIVLAEGYKLGPAPKIEVRPLGAEPVCFAGDLLAVVGGAAPEGVRWFPYGEAGLVADFIEDVFLRSELGVASSYL